MPPDGPTTAHSPGIGDRLTIQAELDSLTNAPVEPAPAKRPLVLSEPAKTRREWALRASGKAL